MTISNSKRTLFAGFLSIATFTIMASCGNDTNSSTSSEMPSVNDSMAKMTADSTAAAAASKMAVKKRKGKASTAMMAMDNTVKVKKGKDGIYSKAEKMPEYPGGESALSTFVSNNINYPQDAIDQNTEGTVNVSFVVDENGKVINPVATGKSAGGGLDDEAVKVVKQMPAWKPGIVNGKAVKTRLSLPVTFKLADA